MKRRHILLLSDHRPPVGELPLRAGDDYVLTYCANDNRDIERIERVQRPFDWVLIDAATMGGDQEEFFQSLRALGVLLSGDGEHRCSVQSCGVEWDASGTLHLRCARRRAGDGRAGHQRDIADDEASAFVFEYHAPMERTG